MSFEGNYQNNHANHQQHRYGGEHNGHGDHASGHNSGGFLGNHHYSQWAERKRTDLNDVHDDTHPVVVPTHEATTQEISYDGGAADGRSDDGFYHSPEQGAQTQEITHDLGATAVGPIDSAGE